MQSEQTNRHDVARSQVHTTTRKKAMSRETGLEKRVTCRLQSNVNATERKIIVDTYGGWARTAATPSLDKDFSKVDRFAACAARWETGASHFGLSTLPPSSLIVRSPFRAKHHVVVQNMAAGLKYPLPPSPQTPLPDPPPAHG